MTNGAFEFSRFVNNKKDTILERYSINDISFEYQQGKRDFILYYNSGLNQKLIWKGPWKDIIYNGTSNYNFLDWKDDFTNYAQNYGSFVTLNQATSKTPLFTGPGYNMSSSVTVNSSFLQKNMPYFIQIQCTSTPDEVDYELQELFGTVWRTIWKFQRIPSGFTSIITTPILRNKAANIKLIRSLPGAHTNPTHTITMIYTNSLTNNKFQFFERSINLNTPSTSNIYNIEGFSKVNIITNITSGSSGTANLIGSYDNNNWFIIAPINFVTGATAVALSNTDTKNANYLAIRYEDVSSPATPRVLDYICITGSEL